METKHTKGEWKIFEDVDDIYIESDKSIASICCITGWVGLGQDEANAKLISAAPELLEALIECLEGVEELNGEYQEGWDDTINKALNAIKKATE